ncbi:MAG: hypothetical protein QM775_19545 [Pirellulales bacterium]
MKRTLLALAIVALFDLFFCGAQAEAAGRRSYRSTSPSANYGNFMYNAPSQNGGYGFGGFGFRGFPFGYSSGTFSHRYRR